MWTRLQFYPLLLLDHQYKRQYSEKGACLGITKKITFRSQKPPGFHKPHFEKHCFLFYSLFQQKMWNLRRILRWKMLQTSHTWKWFTSLPRQRKMPTAPKSWRDIQRRRTEALWCKALLELCQKKDPVDYRKRIWRGRAAPLENTCMGMHLLALEEFL